MKEMWKDIKGYEGSYQVSNLGNVKSLNRRWVKKEEFLTQSLTKDGYCKVRLFNKSKGKTARVHRLVAEAFIPNSKNKPTVNHKDGNKLNNKVDNLEWLDRHEQLKHAYKLGLKEKVKARRKLTDEEVREIRATYKRQSTEHGTVALAKKYGVTDCTIGFILRGITYKDVN